MHYVSVSEEFSYGHRLRDYNGKCARLHGHNGVVQITVVNTEGELDLCGIAYDFSLLKQGLRDLLKTLDHRMLLHQEDPIRERFDKCFEDDFGVVLLGFNPTAEGLARYIYEQLNGAYFAGTFAKVISVSFSESATTSAIYEP